MQLVDFPGCCTAKIITGFGGTDTAEHRYRPAVPFTENTLFTALTELLERAHRQGQAMVFATTNTAQELPNKVLPRIGFQKVEESKKTNHAEYGLIGWVFRLNDEKQVKPLKVPKNPWAEGPRPVEVQPAQDAVPMAMEDVGFGDFPEVPPRAVLPAIPRGGIMANAIPGNVNLFTPMGVWFALSARDYDGDILALNEMMVGRETRRQADGSIWIEISPNDQGRVSPEHLLPTRDIEILTPEGIAQNGEPVRGKVRDFTWEGLRGDRHRISHFRVI